MKQKVFISYTLRDKELSKEILEDLKITLNQLEYLDTFIDILDNTNNKYFQKEVYIQIMNCDFFWTINTFSINESQWVKKEVNCANRLKKLRYNLSLQDVQAIIKYKGDIKKLSGYVSWFLK